MSFLDDIGDFIGGAANAVPGWAEAAFLPLGVTAEAAKQLFGGSPNIPPAAALAVPPPPDPTDEALKKARLAARGRALTGMGIGQTFLTGPLGDLSAPGPSATLSGY